jgi:signal peptidase I
MGALRLSYAWERVMTLFLPALVTARAPRAAPSTPSSSSSSTPRRRSPTDDASDDTATTTDDDPTALGDRAATTSTASTSGAPFAEAVRAVGEDAMTRVFAFRGDAMSPTLRGRDGGASASFSASMDEYILARRLAHPFRSASVGDVVAFAHPTDSSRTLVRRVSATEGDELVDAVNASVYVVPKDHAWVTADADAMSEEGGRLRHEDSRTFGPVEARALEWRVVYAFRGETDHGAVENSPEALVADAPVIEAELENAKRALGWSSG